MFLYFFQYVVSILEVEGIVAQKKQVHDDSATPIIAFGRVDSFEDLGSHVSWRTHCFPVLRIFLFEVHRQPEVNNLHIYVRTKRVLVQFIHQKHVIGFNIPMENAYLMHIIDSLEKLSQDLFFYFRCQMDSLKAHVRKESASLAKVHNNI
jgi:hypothetical protein